MKLPTDCCYHRGTDVPRSPSLFSYNAIYHRGTDVPCSPMVSGAVLRHHSRRTILRAGGAGLLGLNPPGLLRAEAEKKAAIESRAKSVIFLFQWGGPSHVDMFDMKPKAPDGIRGPYKPIASSCPQIVVGEKLPETAKRMDKV